MSNVTDNFLYPTLTKIHGALDYPILKVLKKEVAANAASIQSDLGGGQDGHLGFIKSPTAYTNVCATPYTTYQSGTPEYLSWSIATRINTHVIEP